MDKVNLADKFARIGDLWSPRIAAELNGQYLKLVKVRGEFVWHRHELEDELFLVTRGEMTIHFRDRSIDLQEGEFLVVPRGVEHRPAAEEEAEVVLLEPTSTVNTGDASDPRTKTDKEWV